MSEKPGTSPPKTRARKGPQPLGALVPKTVGPVFSRRGFAGADLAVHWPEIAGAGIARHSRPLTLQWPRAAAETAPDATGGRGAQAMAGATLVIGVSGAFALDLQQMTPVIIERVNRRLGWRAVQRVTIRQMPIRPPEQPAAPQPPSPAALERASRIAAGIADEKLRAAILRLGAGALTRATRPSK